MISRILSVLPGGHRLVGSTQYQVLKGMYCRLRNPGLQDKWGGPFNGQVRRQQIVSELYTKIQFKGAVETGSFRGDSTKYISDLTSGVVHTIEAVPHSYGYCKMRHIANSRIKCHLGDSPTILKRLIPIIQKSQGPWFFYFDAHWAGELPLREEVKLILEGEVPFVIMVDDFCVPDDVGYKFDDYGPGKALTMDYLSDLMSVYGPDIYFPSFKAEEESGAKRGCVVLVDYSLTQRLAAIASLRSYEADEK